MGPNPGKIVMSKETVYPAGYVLQELVDRAGTSDASKWQRGRRRRRLARPFGRTAPRVGDGDQHDGKFLLDVLTDPDGHILVTE